MSRELYEDVTVIIPTFNEAENIGELISEIARYKGISIIVSDDGSTDGTQEAVKRLSRKYGKVMLLDRSKTVPHGLTASVTDATKQAKTKFLIVMDGDLQHPPEKIPDITNALRKGSDLVACKREKVIAEWQLHRKIISKMATILARVRLMRMVNDPLSGFFGVRTGMFREVLQRKEEKFEKQGYKVLFDFLKYAPSGMKVTEEPYLFGTRKRGTSKIGSKQILSFLKALIK